MAFYKSGIERLMQRARSRRVLCGAKCANNIVDAYTAWLNYDGGNGSVGSTGGNNPVGNEPSGNGGGGMGNGINKWACTANVGSAGNSCQQVPGGTYATLAACIAGTDCEG